MAVLDDEFGGKDASTAAHRSAEGIATLLVTADRYRGLQRGHIDTVLAWLADR